MVIYMHVHLNTLKKLDVSHAAIRFVSGLSVRTHYWIDKLDFTEH